MNSITVTGRLGADAELKYLANGTALASFSIAETQHDKGEKTTVWYSCSIFGARAENAARWLKKGDAVTVVGEFSVTVKPEKTYLNIKVDRYQSHSYHDAESNSPDNRKTDAPDIPY